MASPTSASRGTAIASLSHHGIRLSLDSKKSFRLGIHDAPVSCVEYSCVAGQVISGGWDNTIKCWDPKSGPGQALVGTHNQPERVYSLSIEGYKLVVATAGRHVNVYDLRNMSEPEQQRESPLQHQTRCVECYPNGTGFALGSVEGKIAMEFFDQSESALSKSYMFISISYVFKCHRLTEGGRRVAYPVNTSTFHPVFGTFATGGCDGFVNVWDGSWKRRLIQYPRYPTSIAALSFNRDGSLLAVASSYTYEMGERPHEPDTIFIRDVNDVEIRPRPRANTIPALPQ
ncbi:hypothetical protein BRADI_1g22950v3 [Brachypodium distachyon]|uniref:Uncharacterized protein n=1 Tax=Brachypodium distachyon TaxID=15368 RepID=A0A2K2DKN7_BRADI|nr:hypothetical protein BRADI_1g22950v3 [Brachypodium distachyon]PNT74846.1 hypothetical protein BRADI_1g22950v3 [Brachypodium distachyon]